MLTELFCHCLHADYRHGENGADYAFVRVGRRLYIYLECSDGSTDWKNNIDFPAVPYRREGDARWLCHRGFLRVFRAIEAPLSAALADRSLSRVTVVGYSHGAALAVLAHEYVYYHRPDLRARLEGFGFGCPRVLFGFLSRELRARWEHFTVVRNLDDAVTHLPPAFLGYVHVGQMLEIGERGRYLPHEAHRAENILAELRRHEKIDYPCAT